MMAVQKVVTRLRGAGGRILTGVGRGLSGLGECDLMACIVVF